MSFWIDALATSYSFILIRIPRKFLWWWSGILAWFCFDIVRFRRWTILKNLTIAFPEKTPEERYRLARISMQHLCYGIFEFGMIPAMTGEWVKENVQFHGLEYFEKGIAQKRGVLLMSLHLANGDVGIAALALKGIRFHVISKKFKNKIAHQLWFGVREKMGTVFFEPHGRSLPFDILKVCRNHGSVVFVIDQFMGRPYGIETSFFGRKTGTAYGLSLFAKKTEAPVIPVYVYRDESLRLHVVFEEPVTGESVGENSQDKDLQIQRLTQKYNDRIESIIRDYPEQWMWIHRRWKMWE